MNHAQWVAQTDRVMKLDMAGKFEEAASAAEEMLSALLERRVDSLASWRAHETLQLHAYLIEQAGDMSRAIEAHIRAADFCRSEAAYFIRGRAMDLARAALMQMKNGRETEGLAVAKESLQLMSQSFDPSPIYEELIREIRSIYEKHAAKHLSEG